MRSNYYILDGRTPVAVDVLTWGEWYEKADRRVAFDRLGAVEISTVFLGIDHNFRATGPPVLFETMVFGGPLDGESFRYVAYEEAEVGHTAMLVRVAEAKGREKKSDEDLPGRHRHDRARPARRAARHPR
jgi:hypothetical protein